MRDMKLLLGIAVFLATSPFRAQAQGTLSDGLLAYYMFNGDATDATGNGNDGTVFGATFTTNHFGTNAYSINFSNSSYVSTGLLPPAGDGARTVSGWFNVPAESYQMTLLAYGDPGAAGRFELKITPAGQFALDISSGTLWTIPPYNDLKWHNFVVVVSNGSLLSSVLFYIDGSLQTNVTSDNPAEALNTTDTNPLMFGQLFLPGDTRQLNGSMGDVRVYNRDLTPDEALGLYDYESGLSNSPPVILQQPFNLFITNQGEAAFSVRTVSLSPEGFQWQRNETNLVDGGEVFGSTSNQLVLSPASYNDLGDYAVIITNMFGSTTSSVATLTIVDQSALTNGLLAYYPFNGYPNDASGNGNNGTNFGATFVPDRFGLAGDAIYFKTNNVGTGFFPPTNKASRTISGWFNAAPEPGAMTLLAYGTPSTPQQIQLEINPTGQFELNAGSVAAVTVGSYNDANWHSFVVIIPTNSAVSNVVIYMDDAVQTNLSFTLPADIINTGASHALMFGEYFVVGNTLPLVGALDDVRFYNRAFSDTEVQLLYDLESTTPSAAPVIAQQPRNLTVTNGALATLTVGVSGFAPFSYQWQRSGTNLSNGGDISGTTSSNLTFGAAAPNDVGSYSVIATNAYGSVTSSVATLTVRQPFTWGAIQSPELVNVPFTVTVQARNATNGIASNFTGTVSLSASNGIAISPTNSAAFVNGAWTGKIRVLKAATNLVLTATDSQGDAANANAINVAPPPPLGLDYSDGVVLMVWPVLTPATATLQTSTNISQGWIAAPDSPLQIGSEYVVPIEPTEAHRFYRLQFSAP